MDVSLSMFDVLSLYTEIDDGLVKSTRSVIVHQPTVKDTDNGETIVKPLVIVDNLSFMLFISIPTRIDIVALKQFMINSYCFRHYNSPFTRRSDAYKPKGFTVEEASNIHVDDNIKEILALIDERNDDLFNAFIVSKKKKKKKHSDDDTEEETEEEEEEEVDKEIDEIKDMFTGLERDSVPLIMSHIKEKHVIFPYQQQYRLVFRNHQVLCHFINRFKKEITLHGDECPFNVDVIAYNTPNGSNTSLRPTDKVFKGKASEYIDGQLYQFKDKHDKQSLRFPTTYTRTLQYGLLLPSACDGDKTSTCQQMPNTFENMTNAKKAQYRSKTVAYQTLYVDLYERRNIHTIHLVDYIHRQLLDKSEVKQITVATTAIGMTPTVAKKRVLSDKPIKNQPGLSNFFSPVSKKARTEK